MDTLEGNCFRIVDLYEKDISHGFIQQIKSHLIHGVLTKSERKAMDVIGGPTIDIIGNPDLISVFSLKRNPNLRANQEFPGLVFINARAGIVINAPVKLNPYSNGEDTDHMVIDGKEVPIEERKITGILVSEKNISDPEIVQEILNIAKKKGLPVYSIDHGFEAQRIL